MAKIWEFRNSHLGSEGGGFEPQGLDVDLRGHREAEGGRSDNSAPLKALSPPKKSTCPDLIRMIMTPILVLRVRGSGMLRTPELRLLCQDDSEKVRKDEDPWSVVVRLRVQALMGVMAVLY